MALLCLNEMKQNGVPGMVEHTYHLITGEAEAGRSGVRGQSQSKVRDVK